MLKTLIIKAGASGDVVRTTPLLEVLEGDIYWLTAEYNLPLFPDDIENFTVASLEAIPDYFFEISFDLLINLEESKSVAQLAGRFHTGHYIGVYYANDKLRYTPESATWYDMSLISSFGPERADELKRENKRTYQEHLFGMIGKTFTGERYKVFQTAQATGKTLIGLETQVGKRWPDKYWFGYPILQQRLLQHGYETMCFERKAELRQYLADIGTCSLVVTGDTLAMHIALAYRIPCIAIFNCTSPWEIFDYGVLRKAVSPLLGNYFYSADHHSEAVKAIAVEEIYELVQTTISKKVII